MNPRALAKRALLSTVASVTKRHPVLLPRAAADESSLLDVAAPYRVEGHTLQMIIHDRAQGTLTAALRIPERPNASRTYWRSEPLPYDGPSTLRLDLETGQVQLGARLAGTLPLPLPARRFLWSLDLDPHNGGVRRSRVTGHYVPGGGNVDDAYYSGDNYVDYEAESLTTRDVIVELARRYPFTGTALEIGCATGALLEDLQRAGVDAIGIDFSAWAVERARERVGADRVWQIDIEKDLHNPAVMSRAPFGALIMLSVLEHFADPFGVLERLSSLVRTGGRLFLTTTNAGGLGRYLFEQDWEGYFDWTHLGVDQVSARSLREGLQRLGWRIEQLETTVIWDGNADPTHATLREWFASDARFRRLLVERNLGDLISCVATKL
jgi:SAM-dependent methyltransferase